MSPRRLTASIVVALLALACVDARASIAPEAARVVARYLTATGGDSAFRAERVVHTVATVRGFGFTGRSESWTARPDRQFVTTALGPFSLVEGDDGTVAWRTDPTTNRVVRLADQDLHDARLSTWFALERWAEVGQGGGEVSWLRRDRDSLSAYEVLAVQGPDPGSARPRELWFSSATGLLDREVSARDAGSVLSRYLDWRRVGARWHAFRTQTSVSNMPANTLEQVVDSLTIDVPLHGVSFSPPDSTTANPLQWLRTPGRATLPFEYRARHVWLRASIAGGPLEDVLFDTGASVTVLDSSYAATHGIATEGFMQAAGAGAAGSASFATLPALEVRGPSGDGVRVRDLHVAVLSVSPQFAPYFGRPLVAVLGYDVISRLVSTLDFDHGVLTLQDPAAATISANATALPMIMNGTVPTVSGTLDGHEGLFRLDIGSSSTVDVHAPFVRAHDLERTLRGGIEVAGAGFGGDFNSRVGRARRLTLGPFGWDDPMVVLTRATEGAFASDEFAGNIGNRLLERFTVTLDYEHRRVLLAPGREMRRRDGFTRSGLMLQWRDGRATVASVLPGSAASRAGVRLGDRVDTIDGVAVVDRDFTRWDTLLERGREGRAVVLGVHRADGDRRLTLVLKEMLR